MKNKKTTWAHLLLAFLLFYNKAASQIPVREEPHHRVVLENEYVRLFDGHIADHDTTVPHIHAANSVVVFLSRSTFGIQNVGENPVVTDVNPGDMIYRAFGEKPVNHIVWNKSKNMLHFMVAELLKQHPGNDTCPVISQAGLKFQWQQELARTYILEIARGRKCHLPKSNCAYLLIGISGIVTTVSSGSMHTLQANGFVFFPSRTPIEINGSNNKSSRCVLLQLK